MTARLRLGKVTFLVGTTLHCATLDKECHLNDANQTFTDALEWISYLEKTHNVTIHCVKKTSHEQSKQLTCEKQIRWKEDDCDDLLIDNDIYNDILENNDDYNDYLDDDCCKRLLFALNTNPINTSASKTSPMYNKFEDS